jgi:hypothetical protein
MIIVSFIFLNLFIAIILESFESSQDEESLKVGGDTITNFCEFWSDKQFDPKGTRFIDIDEFPKFLDMIIDEEIRQIFLKQEAIMKGDIDPTEQDPIECYMFNIYKDPLIILYYNSRKDKIY